MVGQQAEILSPALRAEDELRRQMGVRVGGKPGFAFIPVESLGSQAFENIKALPGVTLRAVITGQRAKSLGMESPGALELDAGELNFAQLQFLADPLAPKAALPRLDAKAAGEDALAALALTKYALLLPAILVIEGDNGYVANWQLVDGADLRDYTQRPHAEVMEAARAKLPLEGAENATLVSFRERHGASVHLALVVGELSDSPLTRIHSSCVTGDNPGSLRCDCGGQLQLALSQIIAEGSGVLLYLHQEGRGIGITNKLRAYALQEQGLDTYDANLMLGFEEDERDFSIAAGMLKKLGVSNIRLLTNNPHKIASLEKNGITIASREKLVAKSGAHSHAYIDAKTKKSGHLF